MRGFVVFDDILVYNQIGFDTFFTRRQHEHINVYCLSQFFYLPKRTTRNDNKIVFLLNQTLKDVEIIHRDKSGLDTKLWIIVDKQQRIVHIILNLPIDLKRKASLVFLFVTKVKIHIESVYKN